MIIIQSIKSKIGEVTFRKKLVEHLQTNNYSIPGQPTKKEYTRILKQRIDNTRTIFKRLQKKGILLSPFLEIGAERGQRSMLLVNEFYTSGFMSDISYESLQSSQILKKTFSFKKMPIGISCDAYNLPFRSESIPFIFCFQTLHHFPDPKPILLEIRRVLAPDGYFYFNDEPIRQTINLNLWRRDVNLRWFEKILKAFIILHFISRIGKAETEHGILEETFSLKTWENALNVFPDVDANLIFFPFEFKIKRKKTKKLRWIEPFILQRIILEVLGGGIEALCKTPNSKKYNTPANILDALACPNCRDKPKLCFDQKKTILTCSSCNSIFESKNGIFILLSNEQRKILYPK